MSARDVAFTLMALSHVAGCRGKSATEILAEAVGEIVRLQTALEKIAIYPEVHRTTMNYHLYRYKMQEIAVEALSQECK